MTLEVISVVAYFSNKLTQLKSIIIVIYFFYFVYLLFFFVFCNPWKYQTCDKISNEESINLSS